jgi:hypothetical protein
MLAQNPAGSGQMRNLLAQPMKRVDQDLEDRSGDLRVSCPRFLWTPYCSEKLEDRQHGR